MKVLEIQGVQPPVVWPAHQRLMGVLTRTLAIALFVVPLSVFSSWDLREAGFKVGFFLSATFVMFLFERRDRTWKWTLLFLVVSALVAAVAAPLAGIWLEHIGNPWVAFVELEEVIERKRLSDALPLVVPFIVGSLGFFVWVRTRTERAWPQILCGALIGLPALALFLNARFHEVLILGLLWSGAGAVLAGAIVLADKVANRFDRARPRARTDQDVRTMLTWAVPAVAFQSALLIALLGGKFHHRHGRGNEAAALGALKTIGTSQSLYREGDKDGDNQLDYAGSLTELSQQDLIDTILGGGVKQGYQFRLIHSATTSEFLWMATADPLVPTTTGDRYFVTNHEGVTYYKLSGPFALDPLECQIEAGAQPVGK